MMICARCGHYKVFHDTASGSGCLPAGTTYCDDRHSDPCSCPGFVPFGLKPDLAPVTRTKKVYVIGSMRNGNVIAVANALREDGHDVFDDWISSGPEADDKWQEYEKERGRTYREALAGHHAQHAFALDKKHLDECDVAVLVQPAGKSGHLELGYIIGRGKPGYILLDGEPERYDLMALFATAVLDNIGDLRVVLRLT